LKTRLKTKQAFRNKYQYLKILLRTRRKQQPKKCHRKPRHVPQLPRIGQLVTKNVADKTTDIDDIG